MSIDGRPARNVTRSSTPGPSSRSIVPCAVHASPASLSTITNERPAFHESRQVAASAGVPAVGDGHRQRNREWIPEQEDAARPRSAGGDEPAGIGRSRWRRPGHPRSRTPTCRRACPARSPTRLSFRPKASARRPAPPLGGRRQTRSSHPIRSDTGPEGAAVQLDRDPGIYDWAGIRLAGVKVRPPHSVGRTIRRGRVVDPVSPVGHAIVIVIDDDAICASIVRWDLRPAARVRDESGGPRRRCRPSPRAGRPSGSASIRCRRWESR